MSEKKMWQWEKSKKRQHDAGPRSKLLKVGKSREANSSQESLEEISLINTLVLGPQDSFPIYDLQKYKRKKSVLSYQGCSNLLQQQE